MWRTMTRHIVELVSMYLNRNGYRVETAYDGTETLRKARELKPDLLVLDIMMPGEDGLQVCRALSRPVACRSSSLPRALPTSTRLRVCGWARTTT